MHHETSGPLQAQPLTSTARMETIGADVGGTKVLTGVVDEQMQVFRESRAPTRGLSSGELLDTLERAFREAIAERPEIAGVGIGLPCTIDRNKGIAINAVNLDIVDVPIRDELSRRLGLPVSIDNDGNVAALAEQRYGAARGAGEVVMLTIGTGVGGGLILGGEPYRGHRGAGAELGHMVIQADGPPCQGNCPSNGCLEALASGTALGREGRAAAEREPASALGRKLAAGEPVDGRAVTDAAIEGDAVAREIVASIGYYLGVGLAGYANIFEPEVMVVGGGAIAAGELLLGPAREQVRQRALPPMNETPVVAAELGDRAGMIGAATLARVDLEHSA